MQNTQQRLLRKSFRVIRRNYGCPGNDGISISEIKKNYLLYESLLLEDLLSGTFLFEQSPKHIILRDYLDKEREIFVYNVAERWVQEFLRLQIEPTVEKHLAVYTYAFRRGKSDKDSYRYILSSNPSCILRIDIKNYFNSISKENVFILLNEIGVGDNLLYWVKKSLEHCEQGLPSGNVLSCLLSNLSLKNFDALFPQNYTRYSDDMMFAVKDCHEAEMFLKTVESVLRGYGFFLNPTKTKIIISPTRESIS